jgi:hypothetical protein
MPDLDVKDIAADEIQPKRIKIMMTTVTAYDMDTMQTIMDEMGHMQSTERMVMMQNMIHLNQVPPMVMANIAPP